MMHTDWSTKEQRVLGKNITVTRRNFRDTDHDCCAICKHRDCAELCGLTRSESFVCDDFGRHKK